MMVRIVPAAVLFSILTAPFVVHAQSPSGEASGDLGPAVAVERLSKAMEGAKQREEKRRLLAEIAKFGNRRALDLAVAAAADEDLAEAARAAAGQIAEVLMGSEQPAYLRRLAFLRWVGCLPDSEAAGPVIEALRGEDDVVGDAAMLVIHTRSESRLVELAAGEIASFPLAVQQDLMATLAGRRDASAATALLGLSRHQEKRIAVAAIEALGKLGGKQALARLKEAQGAADGDVRAAAMRGMGELAAMGGPDEADQVVLLEALDWLAGDEANTPREEQAVVVAVQIAQALAATQPDPVRGALEKLSARELSKSVQELVTGAKLLFTIDQATNLAQGAEVSSPDDLDNEGGSKGDGAAIDGDPSTYWDESDGHPLYKLRVELPEASDVSAISLSGWAHHSFSPKDFRIVCDDKVVKTVTGATYADNRLIVLFPRTRCTSVELQITGYYGGSPAVRELGIFDVP